MTLTREYLASTSPKPQALPSLPLHPRTLRSPGDVLASPTARVAPTAACRSPPLLPPSRQDQASEMACCSEDASGDAEPCIGGAKVGGSCQQV